MGFTPQRPKERSFPEEPGQAGGSPAQAAPVRRQTAQDLQTRRRDVIVAELVSLWIAGKLKVDAKVACNCHRIFL